MYGRSHFPELDRSLYLSGLRKNLPYQYPVSESDLLNRICRNPGYPDFPECLVFPVSLEFPEYPAFQEFLVFQVSLDLPECPVFPVPLDFQDCPVFPVSLELQDFPVFPEPLGFLDSPGFPVTLDFLDFQGCPVWLVSPEHPVSLSGVRLSPDPLSDQSRYLPDSRFHYSA